MSHSYIICHWGDEIRKVKLRMNELQKYEVIKELVDHNGSTELLKNSVYLEDK